MKTPTWAIVVGICLMLFGGCSVTKSIQKINSPDILAMQQKMMEKMSKERTETSSDSLSNSSDSLFNSARKSDPNAEAFKNITEGMQDMFAMSEFTKTWTVRFGYIGIFVALIYILSGVFLLIRTAFSIKLVYIALITSIVFSIVESVVITSDPSSGFISKTMGFGNLFG